MPNRKISAFQSVSTPLTGSEIVAFLQSSLNKKGTVEDIAIYTGRPLTDTADVTGAPITLNLNNYQYAIFTGSASISGAKTWAFSNALNGKTLKILFTLTGNFAQTFPSNVKMQNFVGDWDGSTHIWTPVGGAGDYMADLTYNGTNWLMNIYGPF